MHERVTGHLYDCDEVNSPHRMRLLLMCKVKSSQLPAIIISKARSDASSYASLTPGQCVLCVTIVSFMVRYVHNAANGKIPHHKQGSDVAIS